MKKRSVLSGMADMRFRNRIRKSLFTGIFCLWACWGAQTLQAQEVDYGADRANKRFEASQGLLGGRSDFDYLNLENHPAASGVPLGGIGVGNVQFAPDGRFVRIGMNNIHQPIRQSTGSFFTLWYRHGKKTTVRRLVRDEGKQYGISGVANCRYTGLFPRAELVPDTEIPGVDLRIRAFSPLIPHNIKDSSLPLVFFDVEVESSAGGEIAVAFSWEDFIGRGIREPERIDGMDGQIFGQNRSELCNGEAWPERPLEQTFAEMWSGESMSGVRQFAAGPLRPKRANFQNYVDQVALLARCDSAMRLSTLVSYDLATGDRAWKEFCRTGEFPRTEQGVTMLSTPGMCIAGSAVSLKTDLQPGEKKAFRFMLVWYFPELKVDRQRDPREFYWAGGSDYGRYFHNFFSDLEQLVHYGAMERDRLYAQTVEWQRPVLESSMPDWYKFKLINSGYVIYTNMILNKKGDVTVNEGGMGGLAGTMDQRLSAHPFYQKFFTQLDRSEMMIFADAQQTRGNIPHFIGHYYFGMGTVGGRIPTEDNWMIDNTGGWIIQLAKDYEQTGDFDYLKRHAGRVYNGMSFLRSLIPEGRNIPIGGTTYDDFRHPPVYSYGASIYLATLRAARVVAEAMGDTTRVKEYDEQYERTRQEMIRMLWNGRFFSYGCETDGSKRLDNILFTGQLGGQFISRYCGWGDVVPMPMTRASVVSQFKISLSKTPDYYANKVWDIGLGHGIDSPGSQCWPFYLESYTAYAAMQAGYYDDALDIMRHIQLVHLRQGWTWCQNLWNPAELSYMTAPVVWFSTDVLAGAGLNVPAGELRLSPVVKGEKPVMLPLYYPLFWAEVHIDPRLERIELKVTKTFGSRKIELSRIVVEPCGKSSDAREIIPISPFTVEQGAVLDLSDHYGKIVQLQTEPAVLPNADAVPFQYVEGLLQE